MSIEEESYSSSSKRLEGKIAIITGGASGAGEAAVRLFAAHGATVVIADVDDSRGNSRAASLSPQVTFVHCDITSEEDIETLINSTVSKYGSIHVFFNNAGIIGGGESESRSSILDFDAAEFDRIVTVSVRGTALGIKHAARAMIAAGARGGSIICTASAAASKHAIVGLVKNAACELGRFGIRVNCISSFGVWEEDGGGGAAAAARCIGEAAVFLASDESKYISGHNLVVDGGPSYSYHF